MAKKQNNRKLREKDFEDIRSYTKDTPDRRPQYVQNGSPPRPAEQRQSARLAGTDRPVRKPTRRPAPDWEIPEWEVNSRRRPPAGDRTSPDHSSNRLISQERLISPEHRPISSQKGRPERRKPSGVRKIVLFFLAVVMTAVTALFAIFLLFKISDIQVTGDTLEGHSSEEIIRISGCEVGGNLIFLATGSAENTLKTQIPYIQDVKLIRHLPNTLEIRLTAAQIAASVSGSEGWLYVSGEGKVLEHRESPRDGILQILGLSPPDIEPGAFLQLEDSNAQAACNTILHTVADLGLAAEFTRADLSDLSDIRLVYQDRIEFQLGSTLDLDYKIELGCRALEKLGPREQGVMNLALSGDTKRAVFTAGEIGLAPAQTPVPEKEPAGDQTDSSPESGGDDPNADDPDTDGDLDPDRDEPNQDEPNGDYRTDGIPDDVFTGN